MFKGSNLSPPNAEPLERVMADLAHARLDALDLAMIRQVVDPATCPLKFLPWLAAQLNVDVWDHDWPEATKRAAIAAAPEVHRLKGTRKAVRLALAALGADVSIVEWWETEPEGVRGTFSVTVWATGEGPELNRVYFDQLRAAIRAAKPKTRVATLRVGARPDGVVRVGGITASRVNVTVEDFNSGAIRSAFIGALSESRLYLTIQPEAA